jgi:hypothetical protein
MRRAGRTMRRLVPDTSGRGIGKRGKRLICCGIRAEMRGFARFIVSFFVGR